MVNLLDEVVRVFAVLVLAFVSLFAEDLGVVGFLEGPSFLGLEVPQRAAFYVVGLRVVAFSGFEIGEVQVHHHGGVLGGYSSEVVELGGIGLVQIVEGGIVVS